MGFAWVKPEVYPLPAALGAVVGFASVSVIRHATIDPEVSFNKMNRAAGVLENFQEGEKYHSHALRKFVHGRSPEIFPTINKYFSDRN